MKLLTIAIPAYHAEDYLHKGLTSLLVKESLEPLDILVVNDGSTDRTPQIAQEYCDRYPETVRLLNKENGGHGSAINLAIRYARGKYFKVLDADDWIVSGSLPKLLNELAYCDADVIVCGYQTIHMATGEVCSYPSGPHCDRVMDIAELMPVFRERKDCFSFHGLMYRTDFYRASNIHLTEGVYYEDHQYAILPFYSAKDFRVFPFFLYQYLIGNQNQSISDSNRVKRLDHFAVVYLDIVAYGAQHPLSAGPRKEYITIKLGMLATSYLVTALIYVPDRLQGRVQAKSFFAEISQKTPDVAAILARKYKVLLLLNKLHVPSAFFSILTAYRHKRVLGPNVAG